MITRRLFVFLLAAAPFAPAQQHDDALSESEIEKLRDTAYFPADRVLFFLAFLNQRAAAIDQAASGRRRPGREQDIHDLLEQFTSIASDLEDNLEDYGQRHRDLRKVLPKLLTACDRWATQLRTPADDERYNVARKLALEALGDIRDESTSILAEQKQYFLTHPPDKPEDRSPNRE